MKLFAGLLAFAVVIEFATVLVLVGIVAAFGPSDPEGSRLFAERLGSWVGPSAGFVLCFAGGCFVARKLSSGFVARGVLLGALVAAIDAGILLASGAQFQLLFVFSNLGRVLAGGLGGLLVARRRHRL